MALLKILTFPDPLLRKKARDVKQVTDEIRNSLDDMLETMYEAKGIGLAATQVGINKRMLVIDVSEQRDQPLFFINPVLSQLQGEKQAQEGCLSVPDIFENVTRAEFAQVDYLNQQGEACQMQAEELLAVCIQHEIDHLNGKLFVDYLSSIKRQRIRKKIEKVKRLESA